MSNKKHENLAFAEIITQMLWLNGLITKKERENINKNSQKILQSNC